MFSEPLDSQYAAACARWPSLAVDRARYQEAAGDGAVVAAEDLYLALGCLDGFSVAVQEVERLLFSPGVRASVVRACRGSGVDVDDVLQSTFERLLVGNDGKPPRLAQYRGAGPLAAWLRIVAVREALQDRRRTNKERLADQPRLSPGPAPALGPLPAATATAESLVFRDRYRDAFRAAVEEGLSRLDDEERAVLRLFVEGAVTVDRLAPMLGVHRATAARRLARARARVLAHARSVLRGQQALSDSEAAEVCAVLGGELDVSVQRMLGPGTGAR